jgi:lipopolysaccharide biosynthesis glycosyltransferase
LSPLPPDTSHNVIALALDNRMVYGFMVLTHAIQNTASTAPFVLVGFFSGQLSAANQALVTRFLEWLEIEHQLVELTPHPLFTERRHLTITTFSKFVISDMVPSPHLWLDIDTIVRPGWDTIFESINSTPAGISLIVAEKIESPHTRFDGFNAGVLGWTDKPRAQWLEQLRKLPEKRFSSEQFLFNNLYRDNVAKVSSDFNFLSSWHQKLRQNEPRIIHYSGPVKPWHLARRHTQTWQDINPTWQFWFDAESALNHQVEGSLLGSEIRKQRTIGLHSGRLHTGKGSLASWVMKLLAIAGPLGNPLVHLIKSRAS